MRVISFISQLSLTNVGKSGTNDYYLYFPKRGDEVINAFFTKNHAEEFDVTDKETGDKYSMKVTFPRSGAECRIVKEFAEYVRNKALDAGDEVILEKRFMDGEEPQYFMDYIKYDQRMILRYHNKTNAYYTWHPERFERFLSNESSIQIKDNNVFVAIDINYKEDVFLRSGSTKKTPVYQFEGIEHFYEDRPLKVIILEREEDGTFRMAKPYDWKFHEIDTET
ncbi:hypothetical protein N780_08620 [Pontibacillus chungwhensis BH030062]|uniref:Uncharacterized protein n=1 Tax=Pontibacillus chungwhensis BH030062 TaxID=1385513 RepID=A0A0A2UTT4_9BACI|nr:hypothetical protein [Pontibacillus chungwhensis]KGP91319.1 hypothetical protein N780_08620 [Pontibacillus chungwhensis BH030062]